MRTFLVIVLAVLCVGVAAYFGHRFLVDEMAWRTDKAVQLSVLRQAEWHLKEAKILGDYPIEPKTDTAAAIIVANMNRLAQDEVIDAKNSLLRLYERRGRALSAEEAAQASRWKQDVAAWEAVNVR